MNNEFRIQQLFALVKNNIDWNNPIPACLTIAQELEKITTLKGPQKLKVLQDALKFGLSETNLDADKKKEIIGFVETTLPQVMQAAILASKHPVVNQALSACFTCLKK